MSEERRRRIAANYPKQETSGRADVSSLSPSDGAIILLKNGVTHTIGVREEMRFQVAAKKI
jgi:hypothetical protein